VRYADLGPVRLAHDLCGVDGAPVLLIIGLGAPGSAWVHQVPDLSRQHRVAWYDHRGTGRSTAPATPYTTRDLADDAARLLDHLGWPRAHIVGVSMGGMVAQELCLAHRPRCLSLALIATRAGRGLPTRDGLIRFLRANLAGQGRRLPHLKRLLFPPAYLASADHARLDRILTADFDQPITPGHRLAQIQAVMRHDTRRRLGQLAGLPTLIVKPCLDLLIRPEENDQLHRLIPGSTLLAFPDAGHGIIRQCPERLNQALLGHFASASG